jgi:hypothetical protein
MKRSILLLLLSVMLWGCASPGMKWESIPEDKRATSVIYEIPGVGGDALFQRTVNWMSAAVVKKGGRIVQADKIGGSLSAKVMTTYNNMFVEVPASYTMRVDFKDGKVRVTCRDFEDYWGEYQKRARPVEDADFLRQLGKKANEKNEALFAYLKSGSPLTEEEW